MHLTVRQAHVRRYARSWLSGNSKRIKFMSPKTFQEAKVGQPLAQRISFIVPFLSPSTTVPPTWSLPQSSRPHSASTSRQPMPSSIFHAPTQPTPKSRHNARQMRQKPYNGPKRSKKPARPPALRSARLLYQSTPSERVRSARCLACSHSPWHRSPSLCASKVIDGQ